MLLNIPPNKKGLFSPIDEKNLYAYRAILDETFKTDIGKGKVDPQLSDRKLESFIQLEKAKPHVMDLKKDITFDRVLVQENIANGQKNESAKLEMWDGKGWKEISRFTTIGHKRLLKTPWITTRKIRLTVLESKAVIQLAEIGFYKASARE